MAPFFNPDSAEVSGVILPDAATASEVVAPDGSTVFGGIPDSALVQDLIAWYRFEDGDARDYTDDLDVGDTTAYDGTVNGATFQSNGGVVDYSNGASSGAFDFDGADDSITRSQISLPSNKTIMLWTKLDNNNDNQTLFYNQGNTLLYAAGGDGYRYLAEGDGNAFNFVGTNVTTVNEYIHFAAAVRDNNDITLYINGTQEASSSLGFATSDRGGTNAGFSIGREVSSGRDRHTANGRIDDVRIYDRALTSTEITDIYDATSP